MGKNNKGIRYLMCRELEKQIQTGTKKRDDRERQFAETGERKAQYIHSEKTIETYMQHARQYGDWLRERGMGRCSLQEAREHAGEYISSMPSAWSQKCARSALARVFDCKGQDLCAVKDRRSEDIVRGRTMTDRAAAIERNHPDLAEVCRSVGVRHGRELFQICPDAIRYKDGEMYLNLIGKGGRPREILVLGKGREISERDLASGRFSGKDQMYHVPSHMNVHAYRADYAARCYDYAARHNLASGETYHSRKLGKDYDKGCLSFVDQNLGHGGERFYTAIVNYLSYGKSDK